MRIILRALVFLGIPVIAASFCFAASFQDKDLEGLWYGHQVVTGDAPGDDPRWGYGTATFDDSGNYTANWNSPTQANEITTGVVQLSASGTLTVNNQPIYRGTVSDGKDFMVLLDGTSESQGNSLTILSKRGAGVTFASADLTGTWYGHHIVSGDRPGDDPRWGYGTLVVNASGFFTASVTSPTQANQLSSGFISLFSSGTFRLDNDPLTHGVVNDAKDMLVFIDGSSSSAGNMLGIYLKRGPQATFSSGDVAGNWQGYHVVSGDAPGEEPRWGYGSVEIDNSGNYTATWNSEGSFGEVTSGTIQVSTDGTFTLDNQQRIHGAVHDDKDFMVFIDGTAPSKGNALTVLVKHAKPVPTGPNLLLLNTSSAP